MTRTAKNLAKTTRTIERIHAKPNDHRRWKKLLRISAEVGRNTARTYGTPSHTDCCMTTAVDAVARKCVRQYLARNQIA